MKESNIRLKVGENLKILIKESAAKTQEEFAFEFGIDIRTVGRWVNEGIGKVDLIGDIAEYFGVDIKFFFEGKRKVVTTKTTIISLLTLPTLIKTCLIIPL